MLTIVYFVNNFKHFLLLLYGDIEVNPGPKRSSNIKFCLCMESSPPLQEDGEGDSFIGPWRTLNFHLHLGGLPKWGI